MSCSKEMENFIIRCHKTRGFKLPAIYSRFVRQGTEADTINNLNMIHGAVNPVKCFLTFLIEFKYEIEKVIGGGYYIDVFHSIDYMHERVVVLRTKLSIL